MKLTQTVIEYLNARKACEEADKAKAKAEANLAQAYAKAGVDFAVVDGTKVAIVQGERPKYDARLLAELVTAEMFSLLTKQEVDGTKWKSALTLGQIDPEVASAVTSTISYQQVRVSKVEA